MFPWLKNGESFNLAIRGWNFVINMNGDSQKDESLESSPRAALSQWQLIRLRFSRHRLAKVSLYVLMVFYLVALMAEFFAPYPKNWRDYHFSYCPPQLPQFSFSDGFHATTLEIQTDPVTLRKFYIPDVETVTQLRFFVRGEPYRIWGLLPWDRHFLGVVRSPGEGAKKLQPVFYLMGADRYGRDIF